jgi:hypothetical protein
MTTEEFYAHALLATLPIAIERQPHDQKSEAISFADEYAALCLKPLKGTGILIRIIRINS